MIKHSGASVYRLGIFRNEWNQQTFDRIFGLAAENGITILPYLYGRADGKQGFPLSNEPEYSSWYSWAREVVKRYGYNGTFWAGKPYYKPVTAWEIWNEPNLKAPSPGGVVQPQNYGAFLVAMSNAVRTAQTEQSGGGTQVLMGGLYLGGVGNGNMDYKEFLSKVYTVPGVYSSYDGLSIHPYGFETTINKFVNEVQAVRSELNKQQWGPSRTLWITEIGWPVEGNGGVSLVNESQQASLLNDSFNWTKNNASGNSIQTVIWYNLRDWPEQENWAYHTGLIGSHNRFREAWYAFQGQTMTPTWVQQPATPESDDAPGPHAIIQNNGVALGASGTIDVFYRTPSGGLGHDWQLGGSWGSGTLPGSVASEPHAIVQNNGKTPGAAGTIDVFYRTSSGGLGHNWQLGGVWGSGTLPGSVASDPEAIVQGNGTIDVFYRTPNNELGHDWLLNGVWGSGTLPGSVASKPEAIVQGNGTIDVFYRTPNGELGHNWQLGGVWGAGTLPGSVASKPTSIVQDNGTIDVFYRTPNNELGHNWQVGGGWGAGTLPGSVSSDPHAIVQENGTIDVFYRTAAGELGHNWQLGGVWGSGTLPGSVAP